ncbi:unnamed protein product [Adineta ricciae]|uniref:Uncharacterized protein n=2 Tax=Adineta ricciae TaxID=249248 RepID=A0A815QDK5_ADIRI|nr:unnamed protein product [Adineta ricciae]
MCTTFLLLIFPLLPRASNAHFGPKHIREPSSPFYNTVRNVHVPLEYDCALRDFTIEMVNYIAPTSFKANWTTLAQSALQINQCHNTSHSFHSPLLLPTSASTNANKLKTSCHHSIFVHHSQGNDAFHGSFQQPMKTIQAALHRARLHRQNTQTTLCIIIRAGTYYLGTNASASTTSSQRGVIALTSNDSNIVIENYEDERVVLSGGTLLDLKWSVHSKTSTGASIMKAQIPSWVNVDEFNELYVDDRRAIVAKYPNGDPSTQGLYAKDAGFSYDSQSWIAPVRRSSVEIHVEDPYRNGTVFPHYQLGVGGGASVFDPPTNFWSTASPPQGDNYVVPRGLVVKANALPHLPQWSNASTGFVHAFHSGYWGSWIFQIASANSSQNTIMFGRGGFQEARGSSAGGAFYVSNVFEELDSANEWFLDKSTRTLYFMPNQSMPTVFVASQVPCIVSSDLYTNKQHLHERVHETSDHGPINTWARQVYLSDGAEAGVPSVWQHTSYIHHNLLFNNYRSVWPIDHDDGSCFYEDSYNFQVYGGKKNYLGHSKIDHHEIYVYSDCSNGGFGSNNCLNNYGAQRGSSGWDETWIQNTCLLSNSTIPYNLDGCDTANLYVPYTASNKIYIPSTIEVTFICKVNGTRAQLNLQQWQSYGLDLGTTVEFTPDVQTIIEWGRQMLQGQERFRNEN